MSNLAVAQALVNERGYWLDGTVRHCISRAGTRDEAIDLLAEEIEEYVKDMLDHTYHTVPKVVIAALPLPGGYWEADAYLIYRDIASLVMIQYWGVGDPKPASSKNRRPSNRGSASRTSGGTSSSRKAPAKKPANRRR